MHFYLLHGTDAKGKEAYRTIIAGDDNTAQLRCSENFPDIILNELSYCELLDWINLLYLEFPDQHYLLVVKNYKIFTTPLEIIARIEPPVHLNALEWTWRYEKLLLCRIVDKKLNMQKIAETLGASERIPVENLPDALDLYKQRQKELQKKI